MKIVDDLTLLAVSTYALGRGRVGWKWGIRALRAVLKPLHANACKRPLDEIAHRNVSSLRSGIDVKITDRRRETSRAVTLMPESLIRVNIAPARHEACRSRKATGEIQDTTTSAPGQVNPEIVNNAYRCVEFCLRRGDTGDALSVTPGRVTEQRQQ